MVKVVRLYTDEYLFDSLRRIELGVLFVRWSVLTFIPKYKCKI